jgi:hypothetical protein
MDFGGHPYTLDHLIAYTKTAAQLGFKALSVNDHMVFRCPGSMGRSRSPR